jgi:hypothetical protein
MNIFILDINPHLSATYHLDKHIVKMPVEYAQILSTVSRSQGFEVGYAVTHKNHPCSKWAAESLDNYLYLMELARETGAEYTRRYGKWHKSTAMLTTLPQWLDLPTIGLTPFAQAMPDEYRNPDPVAAYRAYYRGAKSGIASWKNREEPWWWKEEDNERLSTT